LPNGPKTPLARFVEAAGDGIESPVNANWPTTEQ